MVESGGERNRTLTIVKSRGMPHSNQLAEYRFDERGVHVVDTYLGSAGVLTGSARLSQEAADRAAETTRTNQIARLEAERDRKRRALESRIADLRDAFASEDAVLAETIGEVNRDRDRLAEERAVIARSRQAFLPRRGQANGPRRPEPSRRREDGPR